MVQAVKKRTKQNYKALQKQSELPFSRRNYQIFGLGIIMLVLGYISLMQGPVDSFWSLSVAPVVLVLSYMIVIPYSFLYREKVASKESKE